MDTNGSSSHTHVCNWPLQSLYHPTKKCILVKKATKFARVTRDDMCGLLWTYPLNLQHHVICFRGTIKIK